MHSAEIFVLTVVGLGVGDALAVGVGDALAVGVGDGIGRTDTFFQISFLPDLVQIMETFVAVWALSPAFLQTEPIFSSTASADTTACERVSERVKLISR